MDDKAARSAAFKARLAAALVMNGLSNAKFASLLDPGGQQKVNGWKRRGRVGQETEAKVRGILARTNMVWLQEGVGEAELILGAEGITDKSRPVQSRVVRPNMHTLAAAVRVMTVDEKEHGVYTELQHAVRLWHYYERLTQGAQQVDLIDQVIAGEFRGEMHVKYNEEVGDGAA